MERNWSSGSVACCSCDLLCHPRHNVPGRIDIGPSGRVRSVLPVIRAVEATSAATRAVEEDITGSERRPKGVDRGREDRLGRNVVDNVVRERREDDRE